MINHLLSIVIVICIYEIFKSLKFNNKIKQNIIFFRKIIKTLRSNKSLDIRKERLLLYYSKSLLLSSIFILIIFFFVIILIFLLNIISSSFLLFTISTQGVIEILFFFIIYHYVRSKINAKL